MLGWNWHVDIVPETRFDDWVKWSRKFTRLPCILVYPERKAPSCWLPFWTGRASILLESGKAGRYTILVPKVELLLSGSESEGGIWDIRETDPQRLECVKGTPIEVIRYWLTKNQGPRLPTYPPCLGGLMGMFSYDLARTLEQLPDISDADIPYPLYALAIVSELYVHDHKDQNLYSVVWHTEPPHDSLDSHDRTALRAAFDQCRARAQANAGRWIAIENHDVPSSLNDNSVLAGTRPPASGTLSLDRSAFEKAALRIQRYISTGDTYQVNLSLRETRPLTAPPESVYEELRRINPSPYMGLFRLLDFTLVSGSPELLVRRHGPRLEARPIAGTRPRDKESGRDRALAEELMAHPKERAEHLMLVDLIRNDLGRVSRYGTVRVRDFMVREDYSHVHHIVSHIEGELAAHRDALDVLAATFPGGTITGAPKVRTMEIIEELEPVRRGPYTGSLGWIGFSGDMELNITIRTLVAENDRAHVQAGAGIVADSVPQKEFEESINKARALWAAMDAAESRRGESNTTANHPH